MKFHTIFAFVAVVLLVSSCDDTADPQSTPTNQPDLVSGPPSMSKAIRRGAFNSYEHNLNGSAVLYADTLNMKSIYLEEFTMTQGPDVRVYMSRSNNFSAHAIEIAQLKTSYASQILAIPVANYADEYKFVLIYCLEFHSLFGYAELR